MKDHYMRVTKIAIATLLLVGLAVAQLPASSTASSAQEPKHLPLCQLADEPVAYNRTLMKVSGTASQGFENFTFTDPSCKSKLNHFLVWLTYGGTMQSGTIYCCPGEGQRKKRKKMLEVEGVSVPLLEDVRLKRFMALLRQKPHTARASLIGVFFAGTQQSTNSQPTLPGYGHMGCCSLLVIQQVESVEP
jgi:hypothetical protein